MKSTELTTFERGAKELIRKVGKYALEGGDELEGNANRKLELSFYKSRDRLEDSMRRLGLTDDLAARYLMQRVKEVVAAAPELARAARQEVRRAQIKVLDEKAREHRQWRIENGLDDPPKRY